MPDRGPILVDCEGSNCPPCARLTSRFGLCSMCGQSIPTTVNGDVKDHKRDDILARLDRGDFDA